MINGHLQLHRLQVKMINGHLYPRNKTIKGGAKTGGVLVLVVLLTMIIVLLYIIVISRLPTIIAILHLHRLWTKKVALQLKVEIKDFNEGIRTVSIPRDHFCLQMKMKKLRVIRIEM